TLSSEESNDLYQRVGMMYQQGALFGSKTVFENCALPLKEHTDLPEPVIREMVRMKLELVGLKGLEDRLPSDISGGQAKRVALVRASIMEPEIVFADEPSAGLDPIAAAGLDHVLRRFRDLFGMTLVVVTHELESIKILADRVIMLGDGEIRARGTVEELFDSEVDEVRGFFHREPPDFLTTDVGSTLLESLNG
ncbi:MAG: ABC transporter ATP-binding protein, partial [Bradymonadaceae bacterium]